MSSKSRPASDVSVAPVAVIQFPTARLTMLRSSTFTPGRERATLTFRPECTKGLPAAGERVLVITTDGAYTLRVLKQLPSVRHSRGRAARFRVYTVRFYPRLLVEIVDVRRCARCKGTGVVDVAGECVVCGNRGCEECSSTGASTWARCPLCRVRSR